MDNKALLLSLVKAESEEEVQRIINHHPLLSKDEYGNPMVVFEEILVKYITSKVIQYLL